MSTRLKSNSLDSRNGGATEQMEADSRRYGKNQKECSNHKIRSL